MDELIGFGTIIVWKDSHYVYLAEIEQITYLARIIEDESKKTSLLQLYTKLEKSCSQGNFRDQGKLANTIYCFVTLSTTNFNKDIAWLHRIAHDTATVDKIAPSCKLNKTDMIELKRVIIEDDGIAKELQAYVKTLT